MSARNKHIIYQHPDMAHGRSFLWWRLLGVLLVLGLLCWGYISYYCDPAPTTSQQLIFALLLTLIFAETIQAGWYRSPDPPELVALGYFLEVGKLLLIAVAGVGVAVVLFFLSVLLADLIAMAEVEMRGLWLIVIVLAMFAFVVWVVIRKPDGP